MPFHWMRCNVMLSSVIMMIHLCTASSVVVTVIELEVHVWHRARGSLILDPEADTGGSCEWLVPLLESTAPAGRHSTAEFEHGTHDERPLLLSVPQCVSTRVCATHVVRVCGVVWRTQLGRELPSLTIEGAPSLHTCVTGVCRHTQHTALPAAGFPEQHTAATTPKLSSAFLKCNQPACPSHASIPLHISARRSTACQPLAGIHHGKLVQGFKLEGKPGPANAWEVLQGAKACTRRWWLNRPAFSKPSTCRNPSCKSLNKQDVQPLYA